MNTVRTGFGDKVDDATGSEAELGGHGASLNFEFLNRLYGDIDVYLTLVGMDVVAAVKKNPILAVDSAVDTQRCETRPTVGKSRIGGAGIGFYGRSEHHQGHSVSAINRQILNPAVLDYLSRSGASRIDERRLCCHFYRLGDCAYLENQIQFSPLIHLERDAASYDSLESLPFSRNLVVADSQVRR